MARVSLNHKVCLNLLKAEQLSDNWIFHAVTNNKLVLISLKRSSFPTKMIEKLLAAEVCLNLLKAEQLSDIMSDRKVVVNGMS